MTTLGQNLKVSGFKIKSTASKKEFKKILREVVNIIGMTPAGKAKTWSFPWQLKFWKRILSCTFLFLTGKNLRGLGGEGFTIVQPLVESFAVIDYWKEHKHWFLVIASCHYYEPRKVANFLLNNCGETVWQEGFSL